MEKKPALEPNLVQEFIGNSHGDLNRVTELLAQEPALINACWDWGVGLPGCGKRGRDCMPPSFLM